MTLSRYPQAASQHANELLEMIEVSHRHHLVERYWDDLEDLLYKATEEDNLKALRFLSETPAKRDKRFAKLPQAEREALWLRARAYALEAEAILRIAQGLGDRQGVSYREMTAAAARMARYEAYVPDIWSLCEILSEP